MVPNISMSLMLILNVPEVKIDVQIKHVLELHDGSVSIIWGSDSSQLSALPRNING